MGANTSTFSGVRARFKISGEKIGFAGGVSGEEAIDYEPVNVLDKLEVQEHVPVAYRVSLSCNIFRVLGKSLKSLGIMPIQNDILTSGALSATVDDSADDDRTMLIIEGLRATTKTFDITARGIVSESVNFVGIRMKDEFELE